MTSHCVVAPSDLAADGQSSKMFNQIETRSWNPGEIQEMIHEDVLI